MKMVPWKMGRPLVWDVAFVDTLAASQLSDTAVTLGAAAAPLRIEDMNMFETFLNSIPKNRSEMVNDLEIPEVTLSPYTWTDYESLTVKSDSLLSGADSVEDVKTLSTDSSLPLSRAMTDSEIDYNRYKRFKQRRFSDPKDIMKAALDAFPSDYLTSVNSFQNSLSDTTEEILTKERLICYNEELRLKMERFFEEECRVYTPEDLGLVELQEALLDLDVETFDADEPIAA